MVIDITPETAAAAPHEQAPAVETKTQQPDVYVEGEPLPPGVLPSAQEAAAAETTAAATRPETAAPVPAPEDSIQKAIEGKLEAGVEEAFGSLEPLAQHTFLVRGQEAGVAVRNLLATPQLNAKVVKELADTVDGWLGLLPGVSTAWQEQQVWATVKNLMELRGS